MKETISDSWFTKRVMKLTCFEKWFMNGPHHARHTERTALALLEHVSLKPQPHCLEIGCGQGALTRLLVERYNARVVASDYDPAQVTLAQERLAGLGEQVEFRVMDVRLIPFDAAQFDCVLSFGVLHHILNGWRQAVTETARVLRPGGWFVFTDMVVPPRTGRLIGRVLPRLDQLEETALHACLADNDLHLEHYKRGRGTLMGYSVGVARKARHPAS